MANFFALMNADQLLRLLNEQIPLTEALQLQIDHADSHKVVLRAPLAPNRNLHGTAFAGSLYCIATLAGWSLLTLFAEQQPWRGAVVLRHGDIRYLRPIDHELQAIAEWGVAAALPEFCAEVARRGRARIVIPVTLFDRHHKPAVTFNGEFVFSAHQE